MDNVKEINDARGAKAIGFVVLWCSGCGIFGFAAFLHAVL